MYHHLGKSTCRCQWQAIRTCLRHRSAAKVQTHKAARLDGGKHTSQVQATPLACPVLDAFHENIWGIEGADQLMCL